ncbi:MAG: single-stranded DNA-binding protein [Saprospiraceae bacterium]|nr:single-stranded DNA-binding protein [Saprospiraceae bacterium]
MRDVNKVILIGRLGKDPDIVNFESGTKKASFPLATGESYVDRNGNRVEQTEWHNIVLWRRLAEIAEQYMRKGDPIYLEGKLKTRSYDDRDGNKRYITEIEALNISMLSSKSESQGSASGQYQNNTATPSNNPTPSSTPPSTPAKPEAPSFDDDLPF